MKKDKILHIEQLVHLEADKFRIVPTNVFEKVIPSFINAVIAFGLATPALIIFGPGLVWKILVIVIFGLYESFVFLFFKDRCLGMKIMDTYWASKYSFKQHLVYNIFYTLSFATFLIYIWFPLDLLLFNLLAIQLPSVLMEGTTLHGYLGGMRTVKIVMKGAD